MESLLLAIIAAVISLFFNKKSEEKEERPRKHQRTQPVQQAEPTPSMKKVEAPLPSGEKVRAHTSSSVQPDVYKYREIVEEPVRKTKLKNRKTNESTLETKELLPAHQDDFIRGVIMSEILGPPRAKRPYRR
jgi:hypothetical protein